MKPIVKNIQLGSLFRSSRLRSSKLLFVLLFCSSILLVGESAADTGTQTKNKAQLISTSQGVPLIGQIASEWSIQIDLDQPISLKTAQEERNLVLRNKDTGQIITDYRVYMGSPDFKREPLTGDVSDKRVILYGERISGDRSYEVEIRRHTSDGRGDFEIVAVSPPDSEEETLKVSEGNPFRILGENITAQFDPQIGESTDSIGLTYNLDINFHNESAIIEKSALSQTTVMLETYQIGAQSNGQISTDNDSDDFKNTIEADVFAEYTINPNFILDVQDSDGNPTQRPFANPLGISFRPVGLEADRDFDKVNYTAELAAWASVPYTWEPVLWLHEQTGVTRPFVPLVLTTSYKFVQDITDDHSANDLSESNNRLEFEGLYKFPVFNNVDFRAQWRGFLDLEGGDFDDYINVGLTYFPEEDRNNGITLSWQTGVLPPNFGNDDSAVLVGWSLSLPAN